MSDQRTRTLSNPANWMFAEFIRVAKMCDTDWIVIENDRSIQAILNGLFLCTIHKELLTLWYQTSTMTLDASDHGVSQRRTRTFVLGSKDGKELSLATAMNGSEVAVGEEIDDLTVLEPGTLLDKLPYRCEPRSEFARRLRGARKSMTGNLVTNNSGEVLRRFPYVPLGGNWEDIPARLMKNYNNVSNCHTGI